MTRKRPKHLIKRSENVGRLRSVFRASQVIGGVALLAALPLTLLPSIASATTPPVVTSIAPNAGPLAGGTPITITGTGFATGDTVDFGTVVATVASCTSATTCTATSPAPTTALTAPSTVDVTVLDGTTPSADVAGDKFTYTGAAAVASISPATGPLAGATSVVITGTGFATTDTVDFGTVASPTAAPCTSATTCTAVSPAGTTAGPVDVTVLAGTTASSTSAADLFTYVAATSAAPAVTSIAPNSGPLAGGTSVTITGTGFAPGDTVDFGNVASTTASCSSATSCTATSPAPSPAVTVPTMEDVTVLDGTTASAIVTGDEFTYTSGPAVASISPTSGPLTGGTSVVITGTGFATTDTVAFGSVGSPTTAPCTSTTTCTATSPAGTAAGPVDVVVYDGTTADSSKSAADQFTYKSSTATGPPTVTSISPTSGPQAGGTAVTITGTGFSTTGTTVDFGTTPSTAVVCSSTTSCTASSPVGGSGTLDIVDVTVTVNGITSATSSSDLFTYQGTAGGSTTTTTSSDGGSSVNLDSSGSGGSTGGLAFTGLDAVPLIALASLLLIGGTLGAAAMRRRIAQQHGTQTEIE